MNTKPFKATLLIIDDSLTVRMQIKEMLENNGYHIFLARDGYEGLKILESRKPDAVLLDILMPEISGLEVCKIIKSTDHLKHIPVIILTHVSDTENKVAGLKSGADDYITKPFEIEELNARIAIILKNRSLQKELIIARDKARKTASEKSNFLSNMSHEIRTPMNGVIGFTNLLLETGLNPEQKEYVETIKRSGESLLVIINDILDLSKLDSQKILFENKPFSLKNMTEDICNIMRLKMKDNRNIILKTDIHPNIPAFLIGDPHRVKQILFNLIGNSVKFTKKGDILISIKVIKKQNKKLLTHFFIKDTGIGIKKDKLESIFDVFSQADSSITREFGGTGLGLSIIRKLTEHMGGKCWVESIYGKGSTFHITCWFKVPDKQIISEKNKPFVLYKPVLSKKLNILLAEDNKTNQLLCKKILGKMGCSVKIAENGIEALNMYIESIVPYTLKSSKTTLKSSFDLIFMDMMMPKMGGVEATCKIRNYEKNSDITPVPVIAMTANVLEQAKELCFEKGMNDFITKPINKELLVQIMNKWSY